MMTLTDGETVAVVDDAAVGPLGANNNDGVLRTGSGLSYVSGPSDAYVMLDTILSGSGAANKVAFWSGTNAITSDSAFHWDSTNNRLGIGTTNAAVYAPLHVVKAGTPVAPVSSSVVGLFQSDNAAGDDSEVHIVSGTSGKAVVYFGDSHHTDEGHISFDNNSSNHYMNLSANRVGCNTSSPGARFHAVDDSAGLRTGKFSKDVGSATVPVVEIVQDHTTGAQPCLALDQDDISEGFIDFLGSDRGVVQTTRFDSAASARVELNGTVYVIALHADR